MAVLESLVARSDTVATTAGFVASEFARWGSPLPAELDLVADAVPRSRRPPTDAESRMAWLETSVRSAVAKAARTHKAAHIIEALGLDGIDATDALDLRRLD